MSIVISKSFLLEMLLIEVIKDKIVPIERSSYEEFPAGCELFKNRVPKISVTGRNLSKALTHTEFRGRSGHRLTCYVWVYQQREKSLP
jgi:hypothetical protein